MSAITRRFNRWIGSWANSARPSKKDRSSTRRRPAHNQFMERLEDRIQMSTVVWTGSAGSNWSDPHNWTLLFSSTQHAPQNGDDVVFFDTSGNTTSVNDISGLSIHTLRIAAQNTSYNISGNSITLGGGGVIGAVQVAQVTGGVQPSQTISLPIAEGSSSIQMSVDPGFTLTYSGQLSGSGAVTKLGTGKLNLTANSPSLSGEIDINSGVVDVSASQALGTGQTFVKSGNSLVVEAGASGANETVHIAGNGAQNQGALHVLASATWGGGITLGSGSTISVDSGDFTVSGAVTHEGSSFSLTKQGTGRLIFSGASTGGTNTTVSTGTLRLSGVSPNLGAVTVANGATLEFSGGSAATVTSLSVSGIGSGSGALLNVNGNNSINGPVTLSADTTIGSTSGGLTLLGNVDTGSVTPGRTLTVRGGGNVTIGGSGTGAIFGTGNINKTETGVLTLSGSGSSTYTGNTTITQGALVAAKTSALGGLTGASAPAVVVSSGASLQLSGNLTFPVRPLTINGGGISGAAGALRSISGFNTWQGVITLGSNATVAAAQNASLSLDAFNTTASHFVLTAAGPGDVNIPHTITLAAQDTIRLSQGVLLDIDQITLNGNGASGNGALLSVDGDNTYFGSILLGAPSTIGANSSGGSLNIATTIDTGNPGQQLTVFASGATVITDGIIGQGSLDKRGSGTLRLAGSIANTYTGQTLVEEGIVKIEKSSALGSTASGTTVNAAGLLALNNIAVTGESLTLNGAASLPIGLESITGSSSWSGPITLSGGGRTIASLAGTMTVSGTIGGGNTLQLQSNTGTTMNVTGVIQNVSALQKTGAGLAKLSGANTFSAPITVAAGTLRPLNNSALGADGANSTVAVGTGATLELLSGPGQTSSSFSFAKPLLLSGAGVGGIGALHSVGPNRWTAAVTINGAGARISSDPGTAGGSAGLEIAGALKGTGNLNTTGPGAIGLTADNSTYTGQITVVSGTLLVENANALGSGTSNVVVQSGGTLGLEGYVFNKYSSLTVNKNITLSGKLTFDGQTPFNNLTGDVILTGNVTLSGSPTFSSTALTATVDGIISGSAASVSKTGSRPLTFAAANTYTGTTTVQNGNLYITGSIAAGVTVNSGALLGGTGTIAGNVFINSGGTIDAGINGPGTLTINSSLNLAGNATLAAQINGTAAGQFDQIIVNGAFVSLGTPTAPAILNAKLGFNMTNQLGGPLFVFNPTLIKHTNTSNIATTTGSFTSGNSITLTAPNGNSFVFNINFAGGTNHKDLILGFSTL